MAEYQTTTSAKFEMPFTRQILAGLQGGKHVYAGTAPEKECKRRIAANKVARRSRRINRQR